MVLREYLEENKGNEKNIFYLLDASEWHCLINKKNGKIYAKRYKTGLFTGIKCAVVYVDEDEITKATFKSKDLALYVLPPKPALSYLISSLEDNNIDGVMFNDYYFMSLEEIWAIYGQQLYNYFDNTVDIIKEIKDKTTRKAQYIRLFLMLPSFYVLSFQDDESYAMEKRQGRQGEVANTIFVFSSRNRAEKFIKDKSLDLEGISYSCVKNYKSIVDITKDMYNYLLIDEDYFVSVDEVLAVEKKVFSE